MENLKKKFTEMLTAFNKQTNGRNYLCAKEANETGFAINSYIKFWRGYDECGLNAISFNEKGELIIIGFFEYIDRCIEFKVKWEELFSHIDEDSKIVVEFWDKRRTLTIPSQTKKDFIAGVERNYNVYKNSKSLQESLRV